MLLGDDISYEYFGFMGSEIVLTPNLDKLADEGILFPQAHVTASVCVPSLVTLLTGLYPLRYYHLIQQRDETYPIDGFKTLPEHLSQRGYTSFEGGKYWEGPYDRAGFTDGMTRSTGSEEIAEHGELYAMAGGDGLSLGRESNEAVYQFIEDNKDQPFYIWYAPMLPHTPHDPPEEFMQMYDSSEMTVATQKYYANITRLDARIGELVHYLDSTGLRENTLLFYLSDNGYEQEPVDEFHPMGQSKGKGSMHEMGFRTPLIFNWPGVIPASEINNGFVSTVDIFPTVLDFAGVDIPTELPGKSLKENILHNTPTNRDTLFGSMDQLRTGPGNPSTGTNPFANDERSYYLTTDQWHFIYFEDRDSLALYNRRTNAAELTNLARDNPELVEKFRTQILRWKHSQISD